MNPGQLELLPQPAAPVRDFSPPAAPMPTGRALTREEMVVVAYLEQGPLYLSDFSALRIRGNPERLIGAVNDNGYPVECHAEGADRRWTLKAA
jgi:hypothetical protein